MSGWKLAKECYGVLRSRRELMLLPFLGALIAFALTVLFALPIAFANWFDNEVLILVTLFAYYYAQQVVGLFVSSTLIHLLVRSFQGERLTLAQGFQFSLSRLRQILSWACLGGVVGVILHRLDQGKEESRLRRLLLKLVGGAWNLVSYFAFPILILEGLGPLDAMRRSVELIVETWGPRRRAVQGFQTLALLAFSLGFVVFLAGLGLAHHTGQSLWLFGSLALLLPYGLVATFLLSSLTQVYRVSLYLYASGSPAPVPLAPAALEDAFIPLNPR